MAAVVTMAAVSAGVRGCSSLATKTFPFSLSASSCYSSVDWNPLTLRTTEISSRKLVIRAARTESKGASLGSRAPNFELPEPLTGKLWKLDDFEAYPALLVMFICNHCPFVIHLKKDIVKLSHFYMKKGLGVIAISSNSTITHPQDGPDFMAEEAKIYKYPFPYLYDEFQEVARSFGAFVLLSSSCLKRMDGGLLSWSIMDSLMIHGQVTKYQSREGYFYTFKLRKDNRRKGTTPQA